MKFGSSRVTSLNPMGTQLSQPVAFKRIAALYLNKRFIILMNSLTHYCIPVHLSNNVFGGPLRFNEIRHTDEGDGFLRLGHYSCRMVCSLLHFELRLQVHSDR